MPCWLPCEADPTLEITIDVARGTIEAPAAGLSATFPLDEFTRERLLNGWDDIGLSLRHADEISAYEARRPAFMPRADSANRRSRRRHSLHRHRHKLECPDVDQPLVGQPQVGDDREAQEAHVHERGVRSSSRASGRPRPGARARRPPRGPGGRS